MNKERWLIAVGSWGVIDDNYTEKEAEDMRVHKARWEQSIAYKMRYEDFLKLESHLIDKHWAYRMFALEVKDEMKNPTVKKILTVQKEFGISVNLEQEKKQ